MRRGVQECPGRAPAGSAHITKSASVPRTDTFFVFKSISQGGPNVRGENSAAFPVTLGKDEAHSQAVG